MNEALETDRPGLGHRGAALRGTAGPGASVDRPAWPGHGRSRLGSRARLGGRARVAAGARLGRAHLAGGARVGGADLLPPVPSVPPRRVVWRGARAAGRDRSSPPLVTAVPSGPFR